jgi:hypothetical protein
MCIVKTYPTEPFWCRNVYQSSGTILSLTTTNVKNGFQTVLHHILHDLNYLLLQVSCSYPDYLPSYPILNMVGVHLKNINFTVILHRLCSTRFLQGLLFRGILIITHYIALLYISHYYCIGLAQYLLNYDVLTVVIIYIYQSPKSQWAFYDLTYNNLRLYFSSRASRSLFNPDMQTAVKLFL